MTLRQGRFRHLWSRATLGTHTGMPVQPTAFLSWPLDGHEIWASIHSASPLTTITDPKCGFVIQTWIIRVLSQELSNWSWEKRLLPPPAVRVWAWISHSLVQLPGGGQPVGKSLISRENWERLRERKSEGSSGSWFQLSLRSAPLCSSQLYELMNAF